MYYFIIILKLIVGLSILNVWLLKRNKETIWRGGNAKNIIEEFEVYGLSRNVCHFIGLIKVSLSLLLLISIWFEQLEKPSVIGLALLLFGSIVMHVKVRDPIKKSFPAGLFFIMCILIAVL